MVVRAPAGDKRVLLAALATAVLYAVLPWAVTGPADTPLFLAGYVLAWLLYWLALSADAKFSPRQLLLWALLARLLWLPAEPWLSDDLYRYLLDGRVLLEGINPFRHPPEHPEIQALAPQLAGRVNHPDIPTIYPAVVQLFGLFAGLLRLGEVGWRVLISVADVALIAVLGRLFGGGPDGWRAAAVYGLCPLAVIESGANGHVEPLALLPLALALRPSARAGVAGGWLGIAALAKLFPLLLLPGWLARRSHWPVIATAGLVFVAGMLPFALGGVDITLGLRTYLEHWSFNGPVFALVDEILPGSRWTRVIPFLVITLGGWWAGRRGIPALRFTPALLALFLVCGPTLHPWYALWVLAFLGPRPNATLWVFVFAMGLSYAVWWAQHTRGEWSLPAWQSTVLWSTVVLTWLGTRLRRPSA